jgi:hypothetical protein
MTQLMGKLGTITVQVEKVVTNLEKTTNQLADEKLHGSLRSSAESMSGILKSVDGGEGYVGKLIKSPEESQRLSQVMQNLQQTTAQLNQTTASINAILARIQNGPGLAHEVLYGEESSKAVSQFGGAADELRLTLKGIRDGNGPGAQRHLRRRRLAADDEQPQRDERRFEADRRRREVGQGHARRAPRGSFRLRGFEDGAGQRRA